MKHSILAIVDYQGRFSSKLHAAQARSGMDKNLLVQFFADLGCKLDFCGFSDINIRYGDYQGLPIVYSSCEDTGLHYKGYIDDVILGLELKGARLLPPYRFLRAHHNKVFMEMLRDVYVGKEFHSIESKHYGTLEDLEERIGEIKFPCVIKGAADAGSRMVDLAKNSTDLLSRASSYSKSFHFKKDVRDRLSPLKYKGYRPQSRHRTKFVVQNLIPGLCNDWKVLIFGDRVFILRRDNRKGDFRASGSGLFQFEKTLPDGMLTYVWNVFKAFDLPLVSIDVAFDGLNFHLIEFQALNFGTLTLEDAPFFFQRKDNDWKVIEKKAVLEDEYARSTVLYLDKQMRETQ
jgi:hypothetical protein